MFLHDHTSLKIHSFLDYPLFWIFLSGLQIDREGGRGSQELKKDEKVVLEQEKQRKRRTGTLPLRRSMG